MTHRRPPRAAAAVAAILALAASAGSARADLPVLFYSTDFEGGLPAEFSAPGASIEPVQGYAGLGQPGLPFSGGFLRYAVQAITDTKLTLHNLPPHSGVSVGFLLGVIDSWDGTELLNVALDGDVRFSHWFQLATGDASSYVAPPGGLLSSGTNLGFSAGQYWSRDRAYDLALDQALTIPHTADTLEVKWFLGAVSGGAAAQWQGGTDESWAIDQVRVWLYPAAPIGVGPGAGITLALTGPHPHPVRGREISVRFALPTGEPARLELFDALGRRLAAQDVGELGPGEHAVRLLTAGRRGPGVGFLRLTQGAATRHARVVLLD